MAGERSVVRIYASPGPRGDAAHEVDAALLGLVRGLLPVPEVLEVRRADPATGAPALLVTSFVDGVRGDELLPDPGRRRAGPARIPARRAAGRPRRDADAAARPVRRRRPEDRIVRGRRRPAGVRRGRPAAVVLARTTGPACARSPSMPRRCSTPSAGTASCTATSTRRTCSSTRTRSRSRALLDWEFGHAGHPYTDLGNLLRFDRDAGVRRRRARGVRRPLLGGPRSTLELARAADLWALVDLAARQGQNPVADRAHALLLLIARTGDLAAAPDAAEG